ncbi:MAG: hypothetical protein CV081_05785 [Nitrospira sp. LK265]|nr:hypothetical protein [Nitrospira sp. LK265]
MSYHWTPCADFLKVIQRPALDRCDTIVTWNANYLEDIPGCWAQSSSLWCFMMKHFSDVLEQNALEHETRILLSATSKAYQAILYCLHSLSIERLDNLLLGKFRPPHRSTRFSEDR